MTNPPLLIDIGRFRLGHLLSGFIKTTGAQLKDIIARILLRESNHVHRCCWRSLCGHYIDVWKNSVQPARVEALH